MSRSTATFVGLILLLSVLGSINAFLPQGDLPVEQALPASQEVVALVTGAVMLFLYGGLGAIGLRLSQRVGFAGIWEEDVSNVERFFFPTAAGLGLGILFIAGDTILGSLHGLGSLPHPPFPTSVVASAVAGIGEEVLFRLFFVSFWTWLISHVLLKRRWENRVFWVVAALSGLAFGASHLPSVMILYDFQSMSDLPAALTAEILLLNGILSLVAAHYLRRYGLLAAVGVHFWTDVVWHVTWGAL